MTRAYVAGDIALLIVGEPRRPGATVDVDVTSPQIARWLQRGCLVLDSACSDIHEPPPFIEPPARRPRGRPRKHRDGDR